MAKVAIDLYVQLAEVAIPFAVAFEICNLLVSTFMRTAFGGRLWLGRR